MFAHSTSCSFEETVEILVQAAAFSELDTLRGVSENIMVGNLPPLGTNSFKLFLNQSMLEQYAIDEPEGGASKAVRQPLLAGGLGCEHARARHAAAELRSGSESWQLLSWCRRSLLACPRPVLAQRLLQSSLAGRCCELLAHVSFLLPHQPQPILLSHQSQRLLLADQPELLSDLARPELLAHESLLLADQSGLPYHQPLLLANLPDVLAHVSWRRRRWRCRLLQPHQPELQSDFSRRTRRGSQLQSHQP